MVKYNDDGELKYNDDGGGGKYDGGRGKCPGNETESEVVLQSQNHKLSSLGDNVFEGEKQYDDPKIEEKNTNNKNASSRIRSARMVFTFFLKLVVFLSMYLSSLGVCMSCFQLGSK